jgi:transposase
MTDTPRTDEIAALVAEFQRLADEPPTLEEIAADLDKIEQLTKELAERDKLIEQMSEALIVADPVTYKMICAALRAADGGK